MIMLNQMDNTLELLNRAIAEMEWQVLANRSIVPSEMYMNIVRLKLKLRSEWCAKVMNLQNDGIFVNRKLLRFLCKGPKYTNEIGRYGTYLIIKAEDPLNLNQFFIPCLFLQENRCYQ